MTANTVRAHSSHDSHTHLRIIGEAVCAIKVAVIDPNLCKDHHPIERLKPNHSWVSYFLFRAESQQLAKTQRLASPRPPLGRDTALLSIVQIRSTRAVPVPIRSLPLVSSLKRISSTLTFSMRDAMTLEKPRLVSYHSLFSAHISQVSSKLQSDLIWLCACLSQWRTQRSSKRSY